jgi:hypothetical protein
VAYISTQGSYPPFTEPFATTIVPSAAQELRMKKLCRLAIPAAILTAVILVGFVQQMPAQTAPPILVGTTGACNNVNQGGPCTQKSTLVQLSPADGHRIRVIGPVGFTVNGLAWDFKTQTLYGTTAIGDTTFHGLITISLKTGKGKPVDKTVVNFGLPTDTGPSPVHSITIDSLGNMVGWYDEFGPGVTDTFVHINQKTGVATEFPNTGINSTQNGLSFSNTDQLWNIDSPRAGGLQVAFLLDPITGQETSLTALSPPTAAALGDFSPVDGLYYGLNFISFISPTTFLVQVDPVIGSVITVGQTVDNLHVIAFVVQKL